MADFMYDLGREKFLTGAISWSSDTIKLGLIDTASYTPAQSTDEFLNDIGAGMRTAISGALASKTTTAGVADAADVTLSSVSGSTSEILVIFKDTGSAATSPLICKMDSYNGLPVTPNGGNITVAFPNDASKIFKL